MTNWAKAAGVFSVRRGQDRTGVRAAVPFIQLARGRLRDFPLSPSGAHDGLREGLRLGLVVATVTWLWLALIDALAGAPFHTATALGGVVPFSLVHYLLNVAGGILLVFLIHGATRYPSLILVALVGSTMIEIGFIMLTAALSNFLGVMTWLSIFGGSVIGAAVAFQLLQQTHPLSAMLREAETED